MKQRFPLSATDPPAPSLIASVLDARYKTLDIISEAHRSAVWESIKADTPIDVASVTGGEVIETPSKKKKKEKQDINGLDILFGTSAAASTVQSSGDELRTYQLDRSISRVEDPLAWWKSNEAKYRWLAVLARRYLSMTATSVQPERVFCVPGLILNKRLSALSTEHANMLIFLNRNCY